MKLLHGDFCSLIVGVLTCCGRDDGTVSGKMVSNTLVSPVIVSGNARDKENGDTGEIRETVSNCLHYYSPAAATGISSIRNKKGIIYNKTL